MKIKEYINKIKKGGTLKKFLLLQIIFGLSGIGNFMISTPAKADSFYPNGDIVNCNLALTTSLSYKNLPQQSNGFGGMGYDASLINGESGDYPENHKFAPDLGTLLYPNARRYPDVASHISVPPNTQINLGFYSHNYSGHNINISNSWLFLSQPDASQGDFTRLGASGNYGSISYIDHGNTITRSGKIANTGSLGDRGRDSNPNNSAHNGQTVYSFNAVQPLIINSRTITPEFTAGGNMRLKYDLTVSNQSQYSLPNVNVQNQLPDGNTFNQNFDFNAGETKVITYFANMGTNYNSSLYTPPARISDPNSHTETIGDNGSIKNIIVERDDANISNWRANQPDFNTPLSITLIPYQIYSNEQTITINPNLAVSKTVSDLDESNVEIDTTIPNEEITYNITVSNTGGNANDVVVADDYDQNKIDILDSNNGIDDGNIIVWNVGTLLNGETKTFTIKARIKNGFINGDYQAPNNVIVTSSNHPDVSDNTQTNIIARANLEIKKYVLNETALERNRPHSGNNETDNKGQDANQINNNLNDVWGIAGDIIKYTLVYRNTGNASSPETYVKDHIPRYIIDNNGNKVEIIKQADILDLPENTTITPTETGYDITWQVGELKPDQEFKSISFRVKLNSDSKIDLSNKVTDRIIDNKSEIGSINPLIEKKEDNAILLVNQPNATIIKGADKVEYQLDEEITYSIEVANISKVKAIGIVKDILPDGLVYKSTNWDATKTRINGSNLEFDVELEANQSVKILITATFDKNVKDLQVFNNKAIYSYKDENNNPRTDIEDDVDIKALIPVLELKKEQVLPTIVSPGQTIIYKLHYKNIGSGYAPDVEITDNLPEHTSFISFIDENIKGEFNPETKQLKWIIGDLQSNQSGTVTFKVVINIPTPSDTEIKNVGTITSLLTPPVNSEVVTTTTKACCLGGNIWDDNNKNGQFDNGEKQIEGVKVTISWSDTENIKGNTVEVFTDKQGHYEYKGLPYYTPITVKIDKPQGYDNLTTPSEFKLSLLPPRADGVTEDYVKDGIRHVTASGCIKFLNAGIYRDIKLADTGQSILLYLVAGLILIILGSAGLYFLTKNISKK